MILSASRRTDLPAYYADWFFHRLEKGYLYTVNPYNPGQRRLVELAPSAVDGIVFWSKNPAPMLGRLDRLAPYAYYWNVTLTPYGPEVEPAFAPKRGQVVEAMKRLAEATSPRRVRWRYDPLVFGGRYTPAWHAEQFARLARALDGVAARCVVSFYDEYAHTRAPMAALGLRGPTPTEGEQTARLLAEAAAQTGILLQSCAGEQGFAAQGIRPGACVDAALLGEIAGRPIPARRDKNQRPACRCAESVDVGAYNTCPGGCAYCYARRSQRAAENAPARFDMQRDSLYQG